MARNVRKQKGHKGETGEINLQPMMNLFCVLIPFLLACAAFASIKIINLNLPENRAVGQPAANTDKKDEGLLLTVAITDKGMILASKGAILKATHVREYHKYSYEHPKGSGKKHTYLHRVYTDSIASAKKYNKFDKVICPKDKSRSLTLFERADVILYALTKKNKADPGTVKKAVVNKDGQLVLGKDEEILQTLPKRGETVYLLPAYVDSSGFPNFAKIIINDPQDYEIRKQTAYDELGHRLCRIRRQWYYTHSADVETQGSALAVDSTINNVIVMGNDDIVFDKLVHVMDVCRNFGFAKISLAKAGG